MNLYREESVKDPLTRIDNRRGFDQNLQDAINLSNEGGTSLCLIMADIDLSKKLTISMAIWWVIMSMRMVASTLKKSVKGRDTVCRIGGEEFAIILPETPF